MPSATGEPAAGPGIKKKQVRFARTEEDEQEEDTLFEQKSDMKSAMKAARRPAGPDIALGKRAGRNRAGSGSSSGSGNGSVTCVRWMVTLSLCASFLGLGMSISVLGPTLEDLATNVNKNISNISYIFAGRATGYIMGSLVGGVLFDVLNPHLLIGFAMLVTAFGMFATPFCKKALVLTVLVSGVGVSMGILDTGGNVLLLNTWGDQAGPHMQALHFSFAAGAFVSPMIAKLLFGSESHAPQSSTNATNGSLPAANASKMVTSSLPFLHGKSSILLSMYAYIVIGAFILLVSFVFFVQYSRSSGNRASSSSLSSGKTLVSKHHTVLIMLLAIFFFWYVGTEVAYGSFIFNYAKDYADMKQSQAAGLNSLFWGTFAACRGLAIFFAACVYPGTLILLSLMGSTVSSLLLVLFSRRKEALWICTALYGASMATTFPSGISWLEQYTTITSKSAAAFVVGAALGEMVLPALLGFLLGHVGDQPLLMYLALCGATITSILFPVMYKLAAPGAGDAVRNLRARGVEADDSEYRRALLDSAGDDDAEPEDESEVEQWNDADFEVIEMDDSLANSPSKSGSSCSAQVEAPASILTSLADAARLDDNDVTASVSVLSDSPQRRMLLALSREKND